MADFEGLIRQALARHDDADPQVRQRVYQSSRNALARMLAAAGEQPSETVHAQHRALENSIARIEAGYAPPPPRRAASAQPPRRPAAPPEPAMDFDHPAPDERRSARHPREERPAVGDLRVDPRLDPPDPVYDEEEGEYLEEDYGHATNPALYRRSRSLPRILGFVAIVAVLALVGWFAWSAVAPFLNNPEEIVGGSRPAGSDPAEVDAADGASYITILSPTDTTGLQTSGRGKAEIVRQGDDDMIRLVSLRPADDRDSPAEPLLIGIGEGALQELAGRRVTVEIQAKSGGTGPATFAVGCDFAGEDACGRKRFRLGLQPEAIVFTIEIPQELAQGGEAFLTVSTDVTSSAAATGAGDAVDIALARLRYQAR